MPKRILIVDDDPFNLDLLEQELADLGYATERAGNGHEALKKVASSVPDLILLDYLMPGMNGLEVLKEIGKNDPGIPVILLTAHGTIERAVEAMKEGACDFIQKPFEPSHIALVVGKALDRQRLQREVEILSAEADQRYHLVAGESSGMKEAIETAKKAAASKSTVLLLGESGTGKEIFARAIHNWSERKVQPFVAINCVGLSKDLLESELFGHEKGAFTGAHQLKKGKMELADGGTVFLDEVGDISQELQTRLLRFLQEREFERVGGAKPVRVDVRIIAATNRDLLAAVQESRFREDLFHRLNVIAIDLPALRERKEDIPALARYFLRRFSLETKNIFTGIAQAASDKLLSYHWPGNVRELANVIERAVVLGEGPEVALRDLPARIILLEAAAARPDGLSYHEALDACRRELLQRALAQNHGNRAAAAKALGLHRTHFFKLMKSLGIE
jgi:DNA-binding NtrC family response regulator